MSGSPPSKSALGTQIVDGFPIPEVFSAESFRSAVNYKAKPDDLFLVTYPKCGTTWVQQILMLIYRQGEPIDSFIEFQNATPFLELTGAVGAETMPRPGAIKVHLPYHLTPRTKGAKYIYVARNPKDCCVSFYHHVFNMPGDSFMGTFDDFFEIFVSETTYYGSYFDHLLEWYKHRNDANVLFITYEEIKENPEESILKLASFIDDERYAEPLRKDQQKLDKILHYSSFKHMKEFFNTKMADAFNMSEEEMNASNFPDKLKEMVLKRRADEKEKGVEPKQVKSITFVRKGIIGDWKNYLSVDQSRRMDAKFAEKTKGTEIPDLWKSYI